jgi:hypothetical protein
VRRQWYAVGAAVAVLAVLATLVVLWKLDSAPAAMQVVVSPHPDDEMQGWARVAEGPRLFPVFVVMTGGESTGNCDGAAGLEEEWGERAPDPLPGPGDQGTERCAAARLDSWHDFLDRAADTLPAGEERAGMEHTDLALPGTAGGPGQLWLGRRSARVALDAGDGDVTPAEVEQAVRAVLDLRGEDLPALPVKRLVATAYFNDSATAGENRAASGCATPCEGDARDLEYEHRDHAAVNDAVTALAAVARDGAWLVTGPHDPEADRRMSLDTESYAALMGLGDRLGLRRDSLERFGAQQVSYGWLAFPGSYWPTGQTASRDGVLFPRVQFFRHVESTQ